jgi:8-oxo-dGTP diphosphatase
MISVTCAIIRNEEDEVLIVQRGEETDHPFKWEFPGGKLAPGETEEDCIIREVEEELSMDIIICAKLPFVEHDYGNKKIRLIPFICDTLDEIPFLSEHLAYHWVKPEKLMSIDFSEADVFVARSYLASVLSETKAMAQNTADSKQADVNESDLKQMINNIMGMKEAEWVATSAVENHEIFLKLMEFSYSSDTKLAFRSSWIITKVCDQVPEIIYPYLPQLVEDLNRIDNESTLRSFLRIISLSDLGKLGRKQHGLLTDFCFGSLNSGFTAVAVKVYSMEILYTLTLTYPELANELSTSIRILMEDGSGAIIARGRMILKKLAEIPIRPGSNL